MKRRQSETTPERRKSAPQEEGNRSGAERTHIPPIAFVGGTGPEGRGLAARFAMAGARVIIGSRKIERAEEAAAKIRKKVVGAEIVSCTNDEAIASAEVICLAFPYEALDVFLETRVPALAGKLVLDVINPLERRGEIFALAQVPEGSAALRIQAKLPNSPVVSAFKNQSATELLRTDRPLEGDVILCSNFPRAKAKVASWIRQIPNVRPVDAGGLENAVFVEGITALLLNLNHTHKALASVKILGLD